LQFLQAQKMEAIGRLAGGVAHDFNNLLTSIVGHADLMLLELRKDDPLVGDIGEIKKAADRATDLTRQLLAFSRKQILQPKVLNLNQVIENMKKMLRRMIGEDIELETNLSPDLGRVLVDPGQIDQVIMNLIVNARDALPRGGKLTIATANAEITEADVRRYIGSKPGAYVLLEVSDNGLGMSGEIQSHIFEPFFTTKELGKGTGLGLSTVYGIVKQSNGYIWVESEPGQGAAFKIYLPRVEGEAISEIRTGKAAPSYRGTETILLAEDNDLVRKLTRSVLEHYGYNLLEARNGEEAYRLGKGYEGPIHLLLTDVVMPGVSGQALAEQIKFIRPEIEVLFMSGYSEEATLRPGDPGLGDHFLQKPFSPSELGKRVRELLNLRSA
jgi:two-component system cell cycle sensor histidine kinase/response regulator CckA